MRAAREHRDERVGEHVDERVAGGAGLLWTHGFRSPLGERRCSPGEVKRRERGWGQRPGRPEAHTALDRNTRSVHVSAMNDNTAARVLGLVAEIQRLAAAVTSTIAADANTTAGAGEPSADARLIVPRSGTQPEQVLACIRQRPQVARHEIRAAFAAAGIPIGENSLSGAIQRLKDRGQIDVVGRGIYRARPIERLH